MSCAIQQINPQPPSVLLTSSADSSKMKLLAFSFQEQQAATVTGVYRQFVYLVLVITSSAVVYIFQNGVLYRIDTATFWPFLANFGYFFLANLPTFWCISTVQNYAVAYLIWQIWTTAICVPTSGNWKLNNASQAGSTAPAYRIESITQSAAIKLRFYCTMLISATLILLVYLFSSNKYKIMCNLLHCSQRHLAVLIAPRGMTLFLLLDQPTNRVTSKLEKFRKE